MVEIRSSIRKVAMASALTSVAALAVAGISVAGADATAPTQHQAKPHPRALAVNTASKYIAANRDELFAGAKEKFVRGQVISSEGMQYVPYTRTYKGLPVVGGDFVIATDRSGDLEATSVAQDERLKGISVTPERSARSGLKLAKAQLSKVTSVADPKLVVHALGDAPRLAWQYDVVGTHEGEPSRQSVWIDSSTGTLLGTQEHVVAGEGTAAYSGPSPLAIDTSQTDGGFSLIDPNNESITCQDADTEQAITKAEDAFGDGDASNKETGCVDGYYALQTENKMLSEWLGRDGMDGEGGWVPLRVGLDDLNAYYDGSQVQIGHNQDSKWISSIDVVAHEFGHGIDDHTPGGISGNGTQEFIADTFGAMTEAYSNQTEEFDEPDFLVGEEIDLVGTGPIRNMYDPQQVNGDPNCYSDDIPDGEVHATAGPGNHWFYLLSAGNAPEGGPESPICEGGPESVTGIGIDNAGKILYNAMLLKTSDSSYLKYRTWTLTAAKTLFPDSCTEFDAVKAAWDAVSVPAQPDDPTCDGSTPPTPPPASDVDYTGIAALDNCSASIIRFADSEPTDPALGLTNGHCYEGGMPGPGEVIVDQPSDRNFTLLGTDGSEIGDVQASKLLYSTMTKTDISLYELGATYQDLADQFDGYQPLTLASEAPADGTSIAVVSGYWKKIYSCSVDSTIYQLKEADWTMENSIKYLQPGCETIGGTSGSPIVDTTTHEVIGANNTGNEDGEECTLNNPCEVDEAGNVTVDQGAAYGQQTALIYTCLTPERTLDLTVEGCELPQPSSVRHHGRGHHRV